MGKWGQNYRWLVKRHFRKHFCTRLNCVQKFLEKACFSAIYGLISPLPPYQCWKMLFLCCMNWGHQNNQHWYGGVGGKKWVNGGKITEDWSRDVFQNIFAHDCSEEEGQSKLTVRFLFPLKRNAPTFQMSWMFLKYTFKCTLKLFLISACRSLRMSPEVPLISQHDKFNITPSARKPGTGVAIPDEKSYCHVVQIGFLIFRIWIWGIIFLNKLVWMWEILSWPNW